MPRVEQDDHRRDEQQVPVAQQQVERAFVRDRLLRRSLAVAAGDDVHTALHPREHRDARHDQHGGRGHERRRTEVDERLREPRTGDRADRAADPQDRKQALALLLAVEVRRERPELGDRRVAEEAHPEEEGEPDRYRRSREDREDHEIGQEEREDEPQQLRSPDALRDLPVRMHHADHQHGLRGAGVELHLGPAVEKDERLAHRLQQVVGAQQEKRREHHRGCGHGLPGLDLREWTEGASEPLSKP
jgi:hypothetical protein